MKLNPVFNSAVTIANYLHTLNPEISPIKLQKSLYFLYAYYGSAYFNQDFEGESEGVQNPKTLFFAEFEAWKYGPVIRDIYLLHKNGTIGTDIKIKNAIIEMEKHMEEKRFVDDLFKQIDSVSDFSLIDRSLQDFTWQKAYKSTDKIKHMSNENIIEEYKERYLL
ncbi:TPA: Panacea domain-containing protein [Bacillus cereus]